MELKRIGGGLRTTETGISSAVRGQSHILNVVITVVHVYISLLYSIGLSHVKARSSQTSQYSERNVPPWHSTIG